MGSEELITCDTCGTKYEPYEKVCPLCGRTNQ
jgi:uncharacterized OB-fold protein